MLLYHYTLHQYDVAVFNGIIAQVPSGFQLDESNAAGRIYYKPDLAHISEIICATESVEEKSHAEVRAFLDSLKKKN